MAGEQQSLPLTSVGVKTFWRDRDICRDSDVETRDKPRHL